MGFMAGKNQSSGQRSMDPLMQGAMSDIMGRAGALFEQGVPETPEYFPGQNYVQMAGDTANARNALRDIGMNEGLGEQLFDQYLSGAMNQDTIGLGGAEDAGNILAGGAQAGQDALGQVAGGMDPRVMGRIAQGGGTPYDAALEGAASGQVNPLVDQMFDAGFGRLSEQFNEQIAPNIEARFVQAGRAGSPTQQHVMSNAAGELAEAGRGLAADLYGGAAESALNRQLTAGQAGLSDDRARRGLFADLLQGSEGRKLAAGQSLQSGAAAGGNLLGNLYGNVEGVRGRAAGMSGMSQDFDLNRAGALQRAGGIDEAAQARQIAGDMERYNHDSNREYSDFQRQLGALGQYSALTAPMAGFGSEQSQGKSASKGK